MNVIWESKNGMALLALSQDIADLRSDRTRCEQGGATYAVGNNDPIWGQDAIPAIDALIAEKTAEFKRLKSTNEGAPPANLI